MKRLYSLYEVRFENGRKRYLAASDMAMTKERAVRFFQGRLLANFLGQDEKQYELRPINKSTNQHFIHF